MTSSSGDEVLANGTKEPTIGPDDAVTSQSHTSTVTPTSNPTNQYGSVKMEPTITSEAALGNIIKSDDKDNSKISAYARLDFDNFTFFVQTLQVILGRKSNDELLNGSHAVDVHLSSKKAISRRHAKIFYNFGTQRFELSIMGRNGAFVDDSFLEKGMTIPLVDGTKIQIGDIPFQFVLPSIELDQLKDSNVSNKPINPSDAISLRTSLYNSPGKKTNKVINDRKNSFKLTRKLSEARRKSLATATSEEISALLGELGVESIEDIEEQDPEFVDAQIRAILGDGHESAIIDEDEDDINFNDLTTYEGDDEIDKLVKQHNLKQGVDLDESLLDNDDSKVDISNIDEEVVNSLGQTSKESEFQMSHQTHLQSSIQQIPPKQRNGPLMGKLATPRMGRPASIQPSSSRLYGRQQLPMNSLAIGSRLQSFSSHGVNYSDNYWKGSYDTKKPPPELFVAIPSIIRKPYQTSYDKSHNIITTSTVHNDPNVWETRILGPAPLIPKIPKPKKELAKKPKASYTMNEIPEQYKTKPNLTFPVMVINVIKLKKQALSLLTIVDAIKEMYPYYKYCPEGWQVIVDHNVRLNKIFKRILQIETEQEKWDIDESYVQEKELMRKKQQELATQRVKEAAIRAEELKQKQRNEMQQSISQNMSSRDYPLGLSYKPANGYKSATSFGANTVNGKPKTIAELASEIRRDGIIGSKAPIYFKSQDPKTPSNIKAQLAANRAHDSPTYSLANTTTTPTVNEASTAENKDGKVMNQDTKKSLAYLQKELFTLYKARKLSYNTTTTTEIITKALATTIAQVNAIGSKAGVGDNALSFLVEKAPQQVSKILDIALSKSIKEKQGIVSGSKPASKVSTPVTSNISSPKVSNVEVHNIPGQYDYVNENNKREYLVDEVGTKVPRLE